MTTGHIEVLVEPFKENAPGPHVIAVVDALENAGFDAEMGPFATTAVGDLDAILAVVPHLLDAGFNQRATSIQVRVVTNND